MTNSDQVDPRPDPSEQEIARLREEIARLKESNGPESGGRRQGWWRPVVAGILVLIAALLAPLSVLATWANGQIRDTDRYLATVAPLADDPDVQDAVATRMEQVIFSYIDIDAAMDEVVTALEQRGLSPAATATLDALSGPLANGIQSFVRDRIDILVQSDAFEEAWVAANRIAHEQLVAALIGEREGAVQIEEGVVTLDLAPLINSLKAQLVEAGFTIAENIPEVAATFTIFQSDDLATVQNLLGLIDNLSTWLPFVGLGLLAAAVAVSRDRRRWILVSGLAVAGSMLLLGFTLNAIRPIYLDALPESSSAAAAGAIYDQLVSFIRMALRGVAVVALTVAVVAWFSAKQGAGASARAGLVRGVDGMRRGTARTGLNTGKFGAALAQYHGPLRIAVVGVAAVLYLAQDHPTGGTALVFVLVTALVLLVLAVLAAEPETEPEQTAPASP